MVIQQSNCFVIVERGAAAADLKAEIAEARGTNETRDGSNVGPGQQAVADYLLRAVVISMGNTENIGVNLGILAKIGGAANIGRSTTEAKVQLVLLDVRSGAQLAAAQGEGSGSNTGLAVGLQGATAKALGGVGVKSESTTSASTVLLQAIADAYNKLVPALQNYKAQIVKGGLGAGGVLRVQGSRTDASAIEK
jgi:hypothetical protein